MPFRRASLKEKWEQARARDPALFDRLVAAANIGSSAECWTWNRRKTKDGYGVLKKGVKNVRAHRMMFLLWYPNWETVVVRHNCNNPCCINPAHLRGGTQKDNAEDRKLSGREGNHKGTANGRAVLTEEDVLEIRSSPMRNADMARKYGVTKTTICNIKKRILWKHI